MSDPLLLTHLPVYESESVVGQAHLKPNSTEQEPNCATATTTFEEEKEQEKEQELEKDAGMTEAATTTEECPQQSRAGG